MADIVLINQFSRRSYGKKLSTFISDYVGREDATEPLFIDDKNIERANLTCFARSVSLNQMNQVDFSTFSNDSLALTRQEVVDKANRIEEIFTDKNKTIRKIVLSFDMNYLKEQNIVSDKLLQIYGEISEKEDQLKLRVAVQKGLNHLNNIKWQAPMTYLAAVQSDTANYHVHVVMALDTEKKDLKVKYRGNYEVRGKVNKNERDYLFETINNEIRQLSKRERLTLEDLKLHTNEKEFPLAMRKIKKEISAHRDFTKLMDGIYTSKLMEVSQKRLSLLYVKFPKTTHAEEMLEQQMASVFGKTQLKKLGKLNQISFIKQQIFDSTVKAKSYDFVDSIFQEQIQIMNEQRNVLIEKKEKEKKKKIAYYKAIESEKIAEKNKDHPQMNEVTELFNKIPTKEVDVVDFTGQSETLTLEELESMVEKITDVPHDVVKDESVLSVPLEVPRDEIKVKEPSVSESVNDHTEPLESPRDDVEFEPELSVPLEVSDDESKVKEPSVSEPVNDNTEPLESPRDDVEFEPELSVPFEVSDDESKVMELSVSEPVNDHGEPLEAPRDDEKTEMEATTPEPVKDAHEVIDARIIHMGGFELHADFETKQTNLVRDCDKDVEFIDTVYEKKQKMEALINQKLSEYDYGSLIGGSEEFKEWEK